MFEQVMAEVRVPRQGGGHPRTRPDALTADKAYSCRRIRIYLRRRQVPHSIRRKGPGGPPIGPGFSGRSPTRLRSRRVQASQRGRAHDQQAVGFPRCGDAL
jgi:hypothetical protein